MGTHWTDKRASKTAIAHALRDRGWTLFGYTADASDSMTDYWAPAHWDGIATKGGAVCVVDNDAAYARGVADRSGRVETRQERVVLGPCPHCSGSGVEPGLAGWTLRKAQEDQAGYNAADHAARRARGDGSVSLFGTVSPHSFRDDGQPRCHRCGGDGESDRYDTVPNGVVWPTFQGNAKGRNWHVERDGRILDSGTGAFAFGRSLYGADAKSEEAARLTAFISRIDRAASHDFDARADNLPVRDAGTGEPINGGVTVRAGKRAGYVELEYASKPSKEHRDLLKARGFRWAPSSSCWYGPAAAAHGLELGA